MPSEVWAALIVAASAVLVAWMQTRTHREVKSTRAAAETAVTQTEQTSNGFAKNVKDSIRAIEAHLQTQDRRRDRFERLAAQQVVNFDDRLLKIEDALSPHEDEDDDKDKP